MADETVETGEAVDAPEATAEVAVAEAVAEETPAQDAEERPAAAADEDAAPAAAADEAAVPAAAVPAPSGKTVAIATGRRKRSVARVRIVEGTGSFHLNGRPLEVYFASLANRLSITEPIRVAGVEGRYDVYATLHGGGTTGQTDALQLGIARGLVKVNPDLRVALKQAGFLSRDPRKVERKKYGLRKARRAPQYTKR